MVHNLAVISACEKLNLIVYLLGVLFCSIVYRFRRKCKVSDTDAFQRQGVLLSSQNLESYSLCTYAVPALSKTSHASVLSRADVATLCEGT